MSHSFGVSESPELVSHSEDSRLENPPGPPCPLLLPPASFTFPGTSAQPAYPHHRSHTAQLPFIPTSIRILTGLPVPPAPAAPSPSTSLSHASPSPLPSVSFWSLLGTLGQLSQASPNESVSEFCWSLLGNSRQLSWGGTKSQASLAPLATQPSPYP